MRRSTWISAALATCGFLAAGAAQAKIGSCEGPITFGTTISATGRNSTLADRWVKMTEVFETEFNKTGGVFVKDCDKKIPIKIVAYDDQSNPSTAVTLYERLATADNVDLFLGPDWSAVAFAVSQVFEKHGIPSVMSNASAADIYTRGLKFTFGVQSTAEHWSDYYFDMLNTLSPKPSSIFFVAQDNLLTKDIVNWFSKRAEAQGMKIVGNEVFSPELKDFTPLTLKMRSAKADIIYIASYDSPALPLIQQMRQMRVKAKDVHEIMTTGKLIRTLGKDAEGLSGEISWLPGTKGDYSEFVTTVLKESDVDVLDYLWTINRLNSYLIMIQAIEKAGSVDRAKVRAALDHGTFKSPVGTVKFQDGGISDMPSFTSQVQDGKLYVVAPPNVAQRPFAYPSPAWQ
ncbi:MAG: periplasmic binding domain protein [Enterovirga sp.]|jgi:branched-chain amino acid transport system substrate-binding protein|nr:periplasmic binding domain protein [Enterovirga sp.]